MTSNNNKNTVTKISIAELRKMVKEAISLNLSKRQGESAAARAKKVEDDKKKANESAGVQKITVEQLRGMVKEAMSLKLKEMGHEWGTEFEPGEEEMMSSTLGTSEEPVKTPEEREKAYDIAMGTHPSVKGWEETSKSELEHAKTMLDRLGTTKSGRATLRGLIKRLEDRLGVPQGERHFAGDRGEVDEAGSAYAPSNRPTPARQPVGLMKHDPAQANPPGSWVDPKTGDALTPAAGPGPKGKPPQPRVGTPEYYEWKKKYGG